jgi:glycerol kinase
MRRDWTAEAKSVLRVDGGMVASDWTMQFLADILDAAVERPTIRETTALGAAWLAGSKAGIWPDADGFAKSWKLERAFSSHMSAGERQRKYAGWQRAVAAVLSMAKMN